MGNEITFALGYWPLADHRMAQTYQTIHAAGMKEKGMGEPRPTGNRLDGCVFYQ